jgi:hypothetical protein
MIPIYRAGWQRIKVRAVMAGSLVALAVSLYFGIDFAQTYGLSPNDGGELKPLPARLAMGGVVISLGVAFAAGMWLYGRQYAARIEFDPAKKQLHLYTVSCFWDDDHVIDLASVGESRYYEEITGISSPNVYAPWTSVRIKGWRWPLIIDQQGKVLHPELMQSLFGVSSPGTPADGP